MVRYALLVGADLHGLTDLQPSGGCDDVTFSYFLKVRCENCGEQRDKDVCVHLGDMIRLKPRSAHRNAVPLSTANLDRRTGHLQLKCKLCGRESSIRMVPGYGMPLSSEKSKSGEKTCLMVFDCNGIALVGFSFNGGWTARRGDDGSTVSLNLAKECVVPGEEGVGPALHVQNACFVFEEMRKCVKSLPGRH